MVRKKRTNRSGDPSPESSYGYRCGIHSNFFFCFFFFFFFFFGKGLQSLLKVN